MIKDPFIAVLGAGIGGLAVAAQLLKSGFDVEVYEQAPEFTRIGSGIQVSPNAMRVLNAIGVGERVRAKAFEPRSIVSREFDTGVVTNEQPLSNAPEIYGAPYLLMHRADLHEAIAAAVPADRVHRGAKLVDCNESGNGVTLGFEDGRQISASMLIAADGVHSLVRSKLFRTEPQRFTKRVAYRTTFPASLLAHGIDDCTKWWGPDRHIVIYYTTAAKDEVYFVTSGPQEEWERESWSLEGSLEALRDDFKAFHPEVQMVLDACPKVYKWALFERDPFASWHTDNIALLGDACHPMMPYMAQGATMALEDAAVLARCIAELQGNDCRSAFERYEAARKPRASEVQRLSGANTWLREKTDPSWVYGYDATKVALPSIAA